jgi:DNA-directed RNA polymerase specialized sigma24 family protein
MSATVASPDAPTKPDLGAALAQWRPFIAALARRHYRPIHSRAGYDRADLAAAIIVRAVEKWPGYDPARAAVSTWLGLVARAASGRIIAQERRYESRPTVSLDARRHDTDLWPSYDSAPDYREPDPADAAAESERRAHASARADALLALLPPREAELVRDHFATDPLTLATDSRQVSSVLDKLRERARAAGAGQLWMVKCKKVEPPQARTRARVVSEPLVEKYRPKKFADVIGQEKIVARLQGLAHRGWLAGRAYWISGKSGSGKTTLAKLIVAEIADPFFVIELDAGTLAASDVQDLEQQMVMLGWGEKPGRGYIVNEAHGLRKPAVRQLLVTLERIPRHIAVVFTSTSTALKSFEDGEDAAALLSRCLRLELEEKNLTEPFAKRAQTIARQEGLDGAPFEKYLTLARRCHGNLRAMLQAVELGELSESEADAVEAAVASSVRQ